MTKKFTRENFEDYIKENPELWELFVKFTFEKIRQGFQHYSHWGIISRIRWETDGREKDSNYKICNNWIAFYARKFMEDYPMHDGFFRIKQLKES